MIYIYKNRRNSVYMYIYILSSSEKLPGCFFQCFTFTYYGSEQLKKLETTGQCFTGVLNHGTLEKNW